MSEKSKVITEYICKYAKDQEDVDCKSCNGKTIQVNGEEVVCRESCPSYEAGEQMFQIVKEKQPLDRSAKMLIGIAVVLGALLIFAILSAVLGIESYDRENPENVRGYFSMVKALLG